MRHCEVCGMEIWHHGKYCKPCKKDKRLKYQEEYRAMAKEKKSDPKEEGDYNQ